VGFIDVAGDSGDSNGNSDGDGDSDSDGDGDGTGINFCLFFATFTFFTFLFTFFLGGYKIIRVGVDRARFYLKGFGVQFNNLVGSCCCWGAISCNIKIFI